MDVLHAGMKTEKEILSGIHGPSGSRFMSIRDLSAHAPCSYVTAVKTSNWLRSRHLLVQEGARQYITSGRCAVDSELESLLAQRRKPCFGIILPEVNNAYYAAIFDHVHQALGGMGHDLFAAIHSYNEETERKQLGMMLEMGMSGVLFFSHKDFNNQRAFENFPLPVVCLGRDVRGFSRSIVSVNNYDVGRFAAHHLIKRGYKEFGYIGLNQKHFMKDARLKGFAAELKRNGFFLCEQNILTSDHTDHPNAQSYDAFLSGSHAPRGVFCYHDLLAVAFLKACLSRGKKVPDEIGIIGCDDLPIADSTLPKLTTVHYPYGHIAQIAVDILMEELNTGRSLSNNHTVKPRIIERESTSIT
ncbi:MAG: substrate-binding domain-containing protein [Clostridia bacterium]|nr:substrate-binding domain-containing protein [Clostridia bacterium]